MTNASILTGLGWKTELPQFKPLPTLPKFLLTSFKPPLCGSRVSFIQHFGFPDKVQNKPTYRIRAVIV